MRPWCRMGMEGTPAVKDEVAVWRVRGEEVVTGVRFIAQSPCSQRYAHAGFSLNGTAMKSAAGSCPICHESSAGLHERAKRPVLSCLSLATRCSPRRGWIAQFTVPT
jgi:hypothetical protein